MTEAMPFLQKTILLSYDPRPLFGESFLDCTGGKTACLCRLFKNNKNCIQN